MRKWHVTLLFCTALACSIPGMVADYAEDSLGATPTQYIIEDTLATHEAEKPSVTVQLPYMVEYSGSVSEVGGVHIGELYPGDNRKDNADFESFLTFDLTVLPADIILRSAGLYFNDCVKNGFPFSQTEHGLGMLYIDIVNYDTLGAEDYSVEGIRIASLDDCPVGPLDMRPVLLEYEGVELLQMRLYFLESNYDNYRDDVVLTGPALYVTYAKE